MTTAERIDEFSRDDRSALVSSQLLGHCPADPDPERIDVSSTTDTMRPFDGIIGRWKTSGTVLDEHGRAVAPIDGTDEYEWMPGGMWVIHRVDVMMGDDHVHALELIGEHDTETDTYAMRAFDGSGEFGTMTAQLNADGTWTFLGVGMRSTLRVSEDNSSMTARWEQQDESGKWIHWMDMEFAAIDGA